MKYTKASFRLIVFLSLCVVIALFFAVALAFDLSDTGIHAELLCFGGGYMALYHYYKGVFIKKGANMSTRPKDLMEHESESYIESESIPLQKIKSSNIIILSDGIVYEFERVDTLGNYWIKADFAKSISVTPQELSSKAVKLVGPKGIKWQKTK